MGALNAPTYPERKEVPEQAKGNPVYEQTRQDMPLWCCGRNCGRNSRVTVFVLGILGIFCSTIVCLSPHYFRFVSLRNDTFYDEKKFQPKPFEFATEANVGLFRYEILEVFEYPWPPQGQRELFDDIHNRELERLSKLDSKDQQASHSESLNIFKRLLQKKFPDEFYDDDDTVTDNGDSSNDDEFSKPSENITMHQNDTMKIILTRAPAESPTDIEVVPIDEIPPVLPGSNSNYSIPTSTPTPAPSGGNPNDDIDVEIGVVQPYPSGSGFDKLFKNGQSGAMWAPILAIIGLIFASIEFFCCIYKCSWLPTAAFLYGAFMLQLMTMFLFMSDDFCNYEQDCVLGSAGFASVIAVICYLVCQMLVCMTPRPPPKYNLLKKPPVRRKKKKKKRPNEFEDDEKESLADQDRFADESSYASNRHLDPYDDHDPYNSRRDDGNSYYDGNDNGDDNGYNDGYDQNGYNDGYDQNGYNDGYDQDGYNDGYDQDGYNNGYDNNNGDYDKPDQRSHDKADQSSYDNDDYDTVDQRKHDNDNHDTADQRKYENDNHDIADQKSYDNDAQSHDDRDIADQRSYDEDAQTHDDYNEDYEEKPASTSTRERKIV